MDLSVSDKPRYLLYSNERIIEGESFCEGVYSEVFSAENLELYLEGKIDFDEMFEKTGVKKENIKNRNVIVSDLEERLEYLKNRKDMNINEGQRIVMDALLKSECTSFALWNGNAVDKYYLLTLLSVIEWFPYLVLIGGWGNNDTVLAIAFDHDFVSSDIEIMLPIKETEKLIYKLDKVNQLCDPNAKKWIEESKIHYREKDKEIEGRLNVFRLNK
ncbi:hypothetical protein FT637_24920 [Bacillus cereus]|nr:hypothetical protein [Bacillus cereus]